MNPFAGARVGTVGALAALPRRIAAREVAARGGELHRGVTRRTTLAVFGHTLLRLDEAAMAARVAAARAPGRDFRSENGFLRLLAGKAPGEGHSRSVVLDQSGLSADDFDMLALFDAFETDVEPFSFRDVILARKYAGLVAGGAGWGAVARAVHRSGPMASLTAKALQHGGGQAIYARHDEGLAELDGQLLLGLGGADDPEDLFAAAETAEAAGEHAAAAALYGRCLAADPEDAVAAFNRANCLFAAGLAPEAEAELARAIRIDPEFVEAWFNLAGLQRARGGLASARRQLERAIAIDPAYADAVFNLASLEFDAGDLAGAGRWWGRYLELDGDSEWARTAARGLRFIALQAMRDAAG